MNRKLLRMQLPGALILALMVMTSGVWQNQLPSVSAQGSGPITVVRDYKHDVSPPVRSIRPLPLPQRPEHEETEPLRVGSHQDQLDTVVQNFNFPAVMPSPSLNFDGIPFPGVNCNCAPPDTNGEVGATQYVQIVNEGLQVFNKSTGASVFGPVAISTLWSGFGGVCQSNGAGDPVVLYDQLANRWVISQFAGVSVPTDECIAVSTTSDATGSYNRYGFHLGTNFFDYPKLGVWPDAYYMSMNVFNSSGTAFLGPQPFAFNRAAMLDGNPATFITPGITGGSSEETYLPSDLDGSALPPAGAPNTFVEWPNGGVYKIFHFHVDFATPGNSSFTLFTTVPAAGFSQLCGLTRSCVPQPNTSSRLDAIADRLMFRLAYRNFGDHESVVANYTVSSGGVAGIRWLELRNVTNGPVTKYQESTYQPDSTWRWMGSAAMDKSGNLAIGYSASSSSVFPSLRYAGRLANDPLNSLAQGEAVLFAGLGSQSGTSSRWGDYSDLTVDPVDDCTFWFTSEYYPSGVSQFNWRTRIGSFKFPDCGGTPTDNPPTVSITNPSNGATVSGSVSVTANASDDHGVTQVEFFVDGGSIGVDTSSPYQASWDTTSYTDGAHTVSAVATDTIGQTGNDSVNVTVQNASALTIHVGDLDSSTTVRRNNWVASVTITVHDSSHNPVANVTVTGNWSNSANGGTNSCVTDSLGQCSVSTGNLKNNVSSTTFSVTDLSGATYAYSSVDNHDPDGDSNGTSITVNR